MAVHVVYRIVDVRCLRSFMHFALHAVPHFG